jgi:hypothetical protein
MRTRNLSFLCALFLAAPAAAQVVGGNGQPDPNYPGLWAWYDASDGVNGPGQPQDGTPAASWQDRSWQGHSLVRASANAVEQPVFRATAANGQPALEFDGDDYLWADRQAEFGTITTGKTVFAVAEVDPANLDGYVFDSSSVLGRNGLITGQMATPDAWQVWTGTGLAGGTVPVARDQFQVHAVVIDQGYQEHFLDGTSIYTAAESMQDMAGIVVGARYTLTNFLVGHVAELLVYDEVLSAADRQAVESYLTTKYASGPPPVPTLAVTNLVAGQVTTVDLSHCTPLGAARVGYSLAGGGPVNSPFGPVYLSPPFQELPVLTIDPLGNASFAAPVPPALAGRTVWFHAVDLASSTLTNALAEVVG